MDLPGGDEVAEDLLIDIIDTAGQIGWVSATQAEALGMTPEAAAGLTVEACYTPASAEALRELLGRFLPEGFVTTLELTLLGRGGRELRTLARCRKLAHAGAPHFRLTKIPLGHVGQTYDDLQADNKLFSRVIADASEAHWCIEFLEPVDINRPRAEVVNQIFANRSLWRIANPAMQALYQLPSSAEFRAFDVRLYWPRTPENEAFVGQIIDSDYRIDAAISSDRRYDGTTVNLENDVRAEIRENYLYRIWGNCRHANGAHLGQPGLGALFDTFPDPALLLGPQGQVLWHNAACDALFPASGPGAAALRRILAHAATSRKRRSWVLPSAGGVRREFLATAHPAHDPAHGAVTLLLLQPGANGG